MSKVLIPLLFSFIFITPAVADHLGSPEGEVVLTVYGKIGSTNVGNEAEFDMAMLEELPEATIQTSSPFSTKVATYQGFLFADLLKLVNAQGEVIRVQALDEYVSSIPISDIEKYGLLLATHENGEQLTIDNKGPLFVVYPFDEFDELNYDLFYNRSVWQVRYIEVE